MSYAERHHVAIATDGSGDFTGYTPVVTGKISAVIFNDTDLDATADITVSSETTSQTIWSESNVASSKTVAPRQPTHDTSGVASLYAAAGEPVEDKIVVAAERVKVVVAQGGASKSAEIIVIVE